MIAVLCDYLLICDNQRKAVDPTTVIISRKLEIVQDMTGKLTEFLFLFLLLATRDRSRTSSRFSLLACFIFNFLADKNTPMRKSCVNNKVTKIANCHD